MRLNDVFGQAAGELRERLAAVSGFKDAAARAVPRAIFPRAFTRFPQRGVNNFRVAGIDQDV